MDLSMEISAVPSLPRADQLGAALRTSIGLLEGLRGQPGDDWLRTLNATINPALGSLTLSEIRSLASDLAWQARERDLQLDPFSRDQTHWTLHEPTPLPAYLAAQHARFDFHFEEVQSIANQALDTDRFEDDALFLGLAGFAALGLRQARGVEFVKRSIDSRNADRRSRHASLHALWFAFDLEDQADRILSLADDMLARGEVDSNVHFRRAFALRRRGHFGDALDSIDRAIALHRGAPAVHQDYVRERELIVTMKLTEDRLQELTSTLEDRIARAAEDQVAVVDARFEERAGQLDAKLELTRASMNDALSRNVEMLGLFVTLVAFVVGTGASLFYTDSIVTKVVTTVLLLIGTTVFFALLRWITLSERAPSGRPLWTRFSGRKETAEDRTASPAEVGRDVLR